MLMLQLGDGMTRDFLWQGLSSCGFTVRGTGQALGQLDVSYISKAWNRVPWRE